MTEVAQRLVDKLFEAFRTASGDPALLSGRLYKTHRFSDLPPDLRHIAADREEDPEERQPCWFLLAAAHDPAIATEAAANPNDRVQPLTERGLAEQPLM